MAILRIHTIPGDEAFLRRVAEPVTDFGPALQRLAADMSETLPTLGGIGLAAPQVGVSTRLVRIDLHDPEDPDSPTPFFLANPRIVAAEGSASLAEGCLSAPGVRVEVPRSAKIEVDAQDLGGAAVRLSAEGLMAIVIQHELDHLDGRLVVDWIAKGCPWWKEGEEPAEKGTLE